jgi:hypothetical protein
VSQRLIPRADGKGRVDAFETMVATNAIRAVSRDDKMHQALSLMEASRGEGMQTMDRALFDLVRTGEVDIEEAARHARSSRQFIDLFEVVVTMGGQAAGFIDDLLDFAATFVDSKQRQLRLSAFAAVNKMPMATPRSKMAVIMRAYRKPPNRTWCPCPESFWAKEDKGTLLPREQVLQYVSVTCSPAIMDMPFARLQSFLANTNCIAAETYARWRVKKGNIAAGVKLDLLDAMKKFYDEIKDFCKSQHDKAPPDPLERWINFAAVAAPSVSNNSRGKAIHEEQLLPKVID